MIVKAKCVMQAFDSKACMTYLPGREYEIEHDGKLASMKMAGRFVFEFDREAALKSANPELVVDLDIVTPPAPVNHLPNLTEDGKRTAPTDARMVGDYPGKYTCKRCLHVFSSLPELGSHSRKCLVETAIAEAKAEEGVSAGA